MDGGGVLTCQLEARPTPTDWSPKSLVPQFSPRLPLETVVITLSGIQQNELLHKLYAWGIDSGVQQHGCSMTKQFAAGYQQCSPRFRHWDCSYRRSALVTTKRGPHKRDSVVIQKIMMVESDFRSSRDWQSRLLQKCFVILLLLLPWKTVYSS